MKKTLSSAVLVATLGLSFATSARADIILTLGNNPQIDESVVFPIQNVVGNPIFGETATTATIVRFGSNEDLVAPSGVARVEADDGLFTQLDISIPSGSFTSLILNLNVNNPGGPPDVGEVDFTLTDTDGDIFTFPNLSISSAGANFFTFTTINGQSILNMSLVTEGVSLDDVRQIDIAPSAVPEPATFVLMGAAVVAAGWRKWRT